MNEKESEWAKEEELEGERLRTSAWHLFRVFLDITNIGKTGNWALQYSLRLCWLCRRRHRIMSIEILLEWKLWMDLKVVERNEKWIEKSPTGTTNESVEYASKCVHFILKSIFVLNYSLIFHFASTVSFRPFDPTTHTIRTFIQIHSQNLTVSVSRCNSWNGRRHNQFAKKIQIHSGAITWRHQVNVKQSMSEWVSVWNASDKNVEIHDNDANGNAEKWNRCVILWFKTTQNTHYTPTVVVTNERLPHQSSRACNVSDLFMYLRKSIQDRKRHTQPVCCWSDKLQSIAAINRAKSFWAEIFRHDVIQRKIRLNCMLLRLKWYRHKNREEKNTLKIH